MTYTIHKSKRRINLLAPIGYLLLALRFIITLPFRLLPGRLMRRLSKTQRLFVNMVIASIMLVFGVWIATGLLNPEEGKAAWFSPSWSYRQIASITSSSTLTDYQVKLTMDTATLITAGKMKSDCNDLRLTDAGGQLLPYWIETGAQGCNSATTSIWTKKASVPSSGSIIYVYYGNPQATNVQDGDRVFEFFDDFSGNSLSPVKWTTGTIGATSGTNFTVGAGLLTGGNTNRTITSVKSFTGDYSAEARTYTTTSVANGFTPVGFWSSTSNGWAVLDHNGTSYYRNDSSWTNFGYNGNTQWTRNTTKVVGTTGTYARVGETSGSATNTGTNSGISGENIRLSARSDNSATNQDYAANWDWVIVRKAASSEPTASFGSEEQSPAPVAYWRFDEGSGTIAYDSTGKNNGALQGSPTWKDDNLCMVGKCLQFNGSSQYASISNSQTLNPTTGLTIEAWIKPTSIASSTNYNIVAKQDWNNKLGYRFAITGYGCSTNCLFMGVGDGTNRTEAISTINLNDLGKWHHVVGVFSSGTLKYYVDGVLRYSTSTPVTTISNTSSALAIARHSSGGEYFPGFIDDVRVYAYARSAAQIRSDFSSRGSTQGISVSAGNASTSTLSDGLVGYWKMDEASWNGTSGEVIDSSGNGNNGTSVLGTEASPSAKFGNAGYFAGNDEAISIADSNSLDLGDNLTISLWTKRNSISVNNYIMQKGAGPYAIGFNASNQLYLDMPGTGNIFTSTASFTDTTSYHHIVFAKNGSSLYVYFDGVSVAGTFTNRTLTDNSSALYLGSNSGNTNSRYPGNMDDVRLYNRQLTPNEIKQLYTFAPGPVAYYDFEEKAGTTLNDKSGNGYSGSITSGTKWTQGQYGSGLQFSPGQQAAVAGADGQLPSQMTVEAWVDYSGINTGGFDRVVARGWTGNGWLLGVYDTGGDERAMFGIAQSSTQYNASKTGIGPGKHHFAGVYDGTATYLYMDGLLVATNTNAPDNAALDTTSDIIIASTGITNPIKIDEVRIYNYPRTQKQIIEDMNAGHPIGGSPVGSQVRYYQFDEGYGSVAHDSSPQRNDGTLVSSPSWVDGQFNKGLRFNGSGKRVTLATPFGQAGQTTATLWYKRTTDASGTWRTLLGDASANIHHLVSHSSTRSLGIWDGSFKDFGYVPPLDEKYHYYAVVYDSGSSATLYVDGIFKSTISTTLNLSTNPIGSIGNWSGGGYFAGDIDEVKIYSAALTANEIKIDYNRNSSLSLGAFGTSSDGKTATNSASALYCIPGDTTSCASPIAEWTLNEGQGTTVNDISGNSNTGTLTNTPTWAQGKYGGAVTFLNSNSYIATSGIAVGSNWTMSAWTKFPLATNGSYRTFMRQGSGVHHILVDVNGLLGTYNSSFASSGFDVDTLSPGWHHLEAVGTGGSTAFYIDGRIVGTSAQQITTNVTQVGGVGSGQNWGAPIDDFKIYNYARTTAQIAWDFNRGKPIFSVDFDECQGSVLHDLIFGNNGTITIGGSGTQTSVGTCQTASTAWGNGATGKFNSSLNFDGTDDYFEITQPNIPTSPNAFTVTGWIKPSSQDAFFITPNSNGIDQWIGYDVDFDRLHISVATSADTNQGSYYSTTNSVPESTWTHYAVSINNRNVKIYLNGKLNTTITHGFDIGGWTGNWRIGQRGNSTYWYAGQMDDFQIFSYVLTETQIRNVMNQSGAVRFGPNSGTP